ncbi:hypothetical protein RCO27_11480 [Sphingosinicella sp. LHD-64]|uniref:hypothetical protein n=1 Tax=Sphingosinicella sp. LHD-64 TaxID=3072139 RepID=UPI00280DE432|nr:hypothetical protein [Sphingosinicella sp. LHD-64]MDQ8756848.1 hypothetical protein [Sphingosinicella sp. LHD-64]
MALGIDDALTAAASGVKLTDTIVKTVQAYRKKGKDVDIERLIEEIRITALQRIDEADIALVRLERMLHERGADLDSSLMAIIETTRWWQPFEQYRLKQIHRRFNEFADSVYSATDDIAALLRCRDQTGEMGRSVLQSSQDKLDLSKALLDSPSVRVSIDLLRTTLATQKAMLNG